MSQLPDEAKELDKELRQVTKDKNEAVRGQDFEKVPFLQMCSELMCCLLKNACISSNSCYFFLEKKIEAFIAPGLCIFRCI